MLWQKPFSTVRLCFSSLRQFLYGIYGLMRTSSHAHICHKWMRGFRLSRKAQAEKTKKNTRLQEDVWTKQIEKKANRMSCGFRGAGPISWNPLQAAKQRSCGYVRTSIHIVPLSLWQFSCRFFLYFGFSLLHLLSDYKHSDCRYRRRALLRPQEKRLRRAECK